MFCTMKCFFGKKSKVNDSNIPTKKLLANIQKDYDLGNENDDGKLINSEGFLNKELTVNKEKYFIYPAEIRQNSFDLKVEDKDTNVVFSTTVLYGPLFSNPNQYILYIDSFNRLADLRCGIGKQVAIHIRDIAEKIGFDIIGAHAVASPDIDKDYMNQEQLEEFYIKYLNGKNVCFKFMPNSDDVNLYY